MGQREELLSRGCVSLSRNKLCQSRQEREIIEFARKEGGFKTCLNSSLSLSLCKMTCR